ncbi:MAG: 4,5-DOPA dioxygenase extradiol [Promethearchaeota archaeon]
MKKMPAIFIGHGSPMNLVLKNQFTENLSEYGKQLPRPKAIMVVSAHWLTRGTFVTCEAQPRMIYDFYGFPRELYDFEYSCPGAPDIAKRVSNLVPRGVIQCNTEWGLDHASYMVLAHLFPKADIPVFELSLDYLQIPSYHYELGRKLALLRQEGVLIIGSGNLVHNLRQISPKPDAPPFQWAVEFDEIIKDNLIKGKHDDLINYSKYGQLSSLAVPTNDHYLPMLYTIALQEKGEPLKFIHEGFQHGSVSMRSFQIGN